MPFFTPQASKALLDRRPLGTVPVGFENFFHQMREGGVMEPNFIRRNMLQEIKDRAGETLPREDLPRGAFRQQVTGAPVEDNPLTDDEDKLLEIAKLVNERTGDSLPTTPEELNERQREEFQKRERERQLLQARANLAGSLAGVAGTAVSEVTNPITLPLLAFGAPSISLSRAIMPQLARISGIEAGIAAGAEVPLQVLRQQELSRLGIGEDAPEILANVGLAAAGGGILGPVFGGAGAAIRRLAQGPTPRLNAQERGHVKRLTVADAQGNQRFPFALKTKRTRQEFIRRDQRIGEAIMRGKLKKADVSTKPAALHRADVDTPEIDAPQRQALEATATIRLPQSDEDLPLVEAAETARTIQANANRGANREEDLRVEASSEIAQAPKAQRALEAAREFVEDGDLDRAAQMLQGVQQARRLKAELQQAQREEARGAGLGSRPSSEIRKDLEEQIREVTGAPKGSVSLRQATREFTRGENRLEPLLEAMENAGIDVPSARPDTIKNFVRDVSGLRATDVEASRGGAPKAARGESQLRGTEGIESEDPNAPEAVAQAEADKAFLEADTTKTRIRNTVQSLAERPNEFVPLERVRARLEDLDREEVDNKITEMVRAQELNATSQADQGAITPEQNEAALRVGFTDVHFVSVDKRAPKRETDGFEVTIEEDAAPFGRGDEITTKEETITVAEMERRIQEEERALDAFENCAGLT